MAYHIFFNELCLQDDDNERLSKPINEAVNWLNQFVDLMVNLSTRYRVRSLRASRKVMSQTVINEYTLGRLLSHREALFDHEKQQRFKILLDRAPVWLENLSIKDDEGIFTLESRGYIFMYEDQIARGLGAAALTESACVSLATHDCWKSTAISITRTDDAGDQSFNVTHFYHTDNLGNRIFEHNPKHRPTAPEGSYAAPIPYDPERDREAIQNLLDTGIQPNGMDEVFCFSGGNFIIFRPHKPSCYHGYQVSELHSAYKARVLRALLDAGYIEKREYDRYIN